MTDDTKIEAQTPPMKPQMPRIGAPAPSDAPKVDMGQINELIRERVEAEVANRLKAVEADDPSREAVTGEEAQFANFDRKLDVFGIDLSESLPGFHLHWFNDEGDRIVRMQFMGYTFVTRKEVALNDKVSPLNQDLGENIAVYAGSRNDGTPLRTYLMKLPNELYAKRQQVIQNRNDEVDKAINRGAIGDSARTTNTYAGTDQGAVKIAIKRPGVPQGA